MKVALLMVGHVRTWQSCKENFKQVFKDKDFDVFITTYDLKYDYNQGVKTHLNFFEDEILKQKDLSDVFSEFSPKSIEIEDSLKINNLIEEESLKFHNSFKNVYLDDNQMKPSYGYYRKLKKGLDLIEDYENNNNFKYDKIIKVRTDVIFNYIDFNFNEDEVLVTGPNDDNEYPEDLILMCNRNNMFNIVKFIIGEFYNPVYETSVLVRPHGLLKNAINHLNLKRVTKRFVNCILRPNDFRLQSQF
jgi:hypothetical protein